MSGPAESWEARVEAKRAQAARFRELDRAAQVAALRAARGRPPARPAAPAPSTGPAGRAGRPRWTPPETLADEYAAGASTRDLAQRYGVDWSTVRRHLLRQGVALRPSASPPVPAEPSALSAEVAAALAAGEPMAALADRLQITLALLGRLADVPTQRVPS